MLPNGGQIHGSSGFHSGGGVRCVSKKLGDDAAGGGIFRGVGKWVAKVLGRKLTFKDLARRVVMTKLANSDEITVADAAKYLGLTMPTLEVYHQMDKKTPDMAANILSRAPIKIDMNRPAIAGNPNPIAIAAIDAGDGSSGDNSAIGHNSGSDSGGGTGDVPGGVASGGVGGGAPDGGQAAGGSGGGGNGNPSPNPNPTPTLAPTMVVAWLQPYKWWLHLLLLLLLLLLVRRF